MANRKLLIGAGATSEEVTDLPQEIRQLIDDADEILVMTPELPSRLEWLASDTDKTREKADERMHEVMEELDDSETRVSGRVGADDPMLAFEEAVSEFGPDHILVVLRPEGRSGWQEKGLVGELKDRFEIPVTSYQPG